MGRGRKVSHNHRGEETKNNHRRRRHRRLKTVCGKHRKNGRVISRMKEDDHRRGGLARIIDLVRLVGSILVPVLDQEEVAVAIDLVNAAVGHDITTYILLNGGDRRMWILIDPPGRGNGPLGRAHRGEGRRDGGVFLIMMIMMMAER